MIELPPLIGHRGAAAQAPENTLLSFKKAAGLGARWVEPDAHLTRDGSLAVIHDSTLNRTTNGRGKVLETPDLVLAGLDAGQGEPVPLLSHLLQLARQLSLGINIELKGEKGQAEATVDALARALDGHTGPVLLSSFNNDMMDEAKRTLPHVPRGVLFSRLPKNWRNRAQELQAVSVHLSDRHVKQATIETIKASGFACAVYTVNDPDRAKTLWSWGVDAIFSDLPSPMAALLRNKP